MSNYRRPQLKVGGTYLAYKYDPTITAGRALKTKVRGRDRLAIHVPKENERLLGVCAGSFVIGLTAGDMGLEVSLSNPARELHELSRGPAFDIVTNTIIESPGSLLIRSGVLTSERYEVGVVSDYSGDRMTLYGYDGKGPDAVLTSTITLSLTAIFAFSSLVITSDGSVTWRENNAVHRVGRFECFDGEIVPFIRVTSSPREERDFAERTRGFLQSNAGALARLSWTYFNERGGNLDNTVASIRELIAGMR